METSLHSEKRGLYSWWQDSHIPKNSKWLQENLTEMDAKVKAMINLIEEDADSFARRAEMYYKRRPELIKHVELHKAYRALSERYDHVMGELRQVQKTMSEAFPDQLSFLLAEDSPMRSLELHKRTSEWGLKQLFEIHGAGEEVLKSSKFLEGILRKESNGTTEEKEKCLDANEKMKAKFLAEVQNLKETLAGMQLEKETTFFQYQQCVEKLSAAERELSSAQKDTVKYSERATGAENEVEKMKEAIIKLESERDAALSQHKEYLERISKLEVEASLALEDTKEVNNRAIKAETEAQNLRDHISMFVSEKDVLLRQYKLCISNISELEKKILVAEEESRMLREKADRAEAEIKKLNVVLMELSEEKESAVRDYKHCRYKISELENELSCSQEDVKRLNSELSIGAEKLKITKDKYVVLEMSNHSLYLETDNMGKMIAMKDQQLSEKQRDLEKFRYDLRNEHFRHAQIEASFHTLQDSYCRSQEEQRALAMDFKNCLELLKDVETCKSNLEGELKRVRDENHCLNIVKLSSKDSIDNLENETLSLRKMKEKLEEKVAQQVGVTNNLQQEISHSKEEIEDLNRSYQGLLEQLKAAGINPECIGSSIKNLQDKNSELRIIFEKTRSEKVALSKKLEDMDELLKTKALLESSLSDVNGELQGSLEKVRELQESCQILDRKNSTLVGERVALLSQLQIITEDMQKLLEKNVVLENSLFGATYELEGLREKAKGLEEMCQLLETDKSSILADVECLQTRFSRLEERYVFLEMEKHAEQLQVEELRLSLEMEKQDRIKSETQFIYMENHVQEESKWRKKESEEQLDKALKSQLEMFILQEFIQDMEEKNHCLLIKCQTHVEASKLADKLISELENESLEQHFQAELLVDEIGRLRMGIYQVFKALENDSYEGKVENEQTFLHHILGSVEDLKCLLRMYEDDKQQFLVENLVLLTLLAQMKSECLELEKKYSRVLLENGSLLTKISEIKEEKRIVEQENDDFLLETLTHANLSAILKSYGSEKTAELRSVYEDMSKLHGKQEARLLEAEHKLKASESLNTELCTAVYALEVDSLETSKMKEGLEKKIFEISRDNTALNKEIVCLEEVNMNLVGELGKLYEEIEKKRIREDCLSSELQEKESECGLWEAEATIFYFDFQASSIKESLLENKMVEFHGVYGRLEGENASKSLEIEQLKGTINSMGSEIAELKSQLHAISSLKDNVISVEHNIAGSQESKCGEVEVHPDESSFGKLIEDEPVVTKVIPEVSLYNKTYLDSSEVSENEKTKPKSFDLRSRILMKDISLDPVSDGSPQRVRRRGSSGTDKEDDQMLELWETTDEYSPMQSVKDLKKRAIYPAVCNQYTSFERRSNCSPTESQVEKEFGVGKLELSMSCRETNKKILEQLTSDAEKLMTLQMSVDNMRRKLDTNKKARKARSVDFEVTKEKLQEVELKVVQLVNLNSHLMKNTEERTLVTGRSSLTDSKERRMRVLEQARKGSEKIGQLRLEVQKLQYMLLKMDDESRFLRTNTGITLKNFMHIGKRNSEKRKKVRHLCGCFIPSSNRYNVQ